jgi:hypothetical protein
MRIKERYQLAADLRERYWAASRRQRGAMLDAFCLTTGYSRKYAISMLRGRRRKPGVVRKRRRRRYGKAFQTDLGVLWEAAGYICADRLRPFLPDLLQLLEKHHQLLPTPPTRALLLAASTSTISRAGYRLSRLPAGGFLTISNQRRNNTKRGNKDIRCPRRDLIPLLERQSCIDHEPSDADSRGPGHNGAYGTPDE